MIASPCPICGDKDIRRDSFDGVLFLCCSNCGCRGGNIRIKNGRVRVKKGMTEEECWALVYTKWNTRKDYAKENAELKQLIERFMPRSYWSEGSKNLVQRLRGIYSVGADPQNPEFGYRNFSGFIAPIQLEAAQRIEDLEEELRGKRERG